MAAQSHKFPFLDHFTLAEAEIVETWRAHVSDAQIRNLTSWGVESRFRKDLPGRSVPEIWRYLARNRRREERDSDPPDAA